MSDTERLTGEEIVRQAFAELTPEQTHDILVAIRIHHEPCEICADRELASDPQKEK